MKRSPVALVTGLFYYLPFHSNPHTMNKIHLLAAVALLAACSAPKKYPYYFDHTSVNSRSTVQAPVAAQAPQIAQPEQLQASIEPSVAESRPVSTTSQPEKKRKVTASHKEQRQVRREAKHEIKSLLKELKRPESTTATKADASKNGFAIAGFVVSIVGFLVFWPLCIVGLILSAIGLKSERRGLAIAGLVVGVVAIAIILALGAAIVAA
jgi:hypothetical protein